MDVRSGRLVADMNEDLQPARLTPIPPELRRAAERKLNGKPEATINLRSSTPLSKWAKQKRKEKLAQTSRRRNRK